MIWLAQLEECVTLDFGVVNLSSTCGIVITKKTKQNKNLKK